MREPHARPAIRHYEPIRYDDPADAFRPYDPRCPAVARRVAEIIHAEMPDATVEHIGSTAIPGCAGKGVVDLMLLYGPGQLAAARDALARLGFQRVFSPHTFGEDRPVRVGTIEHDGGTFRLHAHVIAAGDPEVERQRRFRERLRADPGLVAEYVARKRATLTSGVADSKEYNDAKDPFIQGVLTPDEPR